MIVIIEEGTLKGLEKITILTNAANVSFSLLCMLLLTWFGLAGLDSLLHLACCGLVCSPVVCLSLCIITILVFGRHW